MPIYIVSPGNRLVRANTYGQAVNYAAKAMFKAVPVKSDTLADLLAQGVKIEDARAPVNQELPLENGGISPKPAPAVDAAPAAALDPLPATGGPLEPEVTYQQPDHFGEAPLRPRARGPIITQPDDVDTVNFEGIDHVQ